MQTEQNTDKHRSCRYLPVSVKLHQLQNNFRIWQNRCFTLHQVVTLLRAQVKPEQTLFQPICTQRIQSRKLLHLHVHVDEQKQKVEVNSEHITDVTVTAIDFFPPDSHIITQKKRKRQSKKKCKFFGFGVFFFFFPLQSSLHAIFLFSP